MILDLASETLMRSFFLCQVNTFGVGELVKVLEELETVKRLQAGHGEWTDSMTPVCWALVSIQLQFNTYVVFCCCSCEAINRSLNK